MAIIMEIDVIEKSGFTLIKFNKDKLLGTEGVDFQNYVLDILDRGVHSIVVDLSLINFITSWGIGMLVHAFITTINRDAHFTLVGVNDKVRTILSKVKMDKIFHIKDQV